MTLEAAKRRAGELDRIDEILPGIYLGGFAGVGNLAALRAAGITHLVSLREERPEDKDEFRFLHLPMSDSGESHLEALIPQAARFIDSALRGGGRVLVFCDLGINRSPALMAGYLISKGWSFERAFELIGRARSLMGVVEPYSTQLREMAGRGAVSETCPELFDV
jgi:protein-tyrosine phosphatase